MAFFIMALVGNGTGGTEASVAQADIPDDGFIVGVSAHLSAETDTDGDSVTAELGFGSQGQRSVNDSRGVIALVRTRVDGAVAAGVVNSSVNMFTPMELAVAGGERIFIHIDATAGIVSSVNFLVHLDTRRNIPRRSTRRG